MGLYNNTFVRYNLVAITATVVDFSLLIGLTECLHFWYMASAMIGAIAGGMVAFVLERRWTFKKRDKSLTKQLIKYIVIWLCSFALNVGLLYLFTEYFGLQYIVSKVVVAVLVGVFFNYFSHKYIIFR